MVEGNLAENSCNEDKTTTTEQQLQHFKIPGSATEFDEDLIEVLIG